MGKGRLEAFSDGVIAIILTIMVLSLIPLRHQWIAGALYVAVALMWLVPDKRIERVMASRQNKG